ncbi:MAG: hypothetical protein AB7U82_01915 [Blastocatellales bacterium]
MANAITSPLPPLYAKWFDELLGGEIPPETRATCHDCAMCDSGGEHQKPGSNLFNPNSKCCTYLPRLNNFLVGMILTDEDPAMAQGRASVEARLEAGIGVTPLGLEQPLKRRLLYTQMEPRAFGRAQSMRCPHYIDEQGGLCGVWKYRNSVCSTWFCKYERGATSRNFWDVSKFLLLNVEDELSRWCAVKLELEETALALSLPPRLESGFGLALTRPTLTLEDIDDLVDADKQRRFWGNWHGREWEFYRACAELVAPLTWAEALAICGPETQARARLTLKAYRQMKADDIPERLRMGDFMVMEANPDFYSLYHPDIGMDAFKLSARIIRLLPYFDGQPTAEIVNQIVEKEGLRFTDELLRRLVDFKILLPVEG